jgi:thiamine pyrophosphate-dependent acetolactate synthase large subunit-like protein
VELTGGAAVVQALERNGVRFVFGIPGTHNLEIYRYLGDSVIEHVAVRHEQGGGYAADGYARSTGEPGVCLTTSGPGLTNACTAAATAYADSVPLLLISPGPPRGLERLDLGLLHEMKDQQAHLASLVSASTRVSHAEQIGDVIDEIFNGWRSKRPRPVHVEIPVDLLEAPWSPAGSKTRDGLGGAPASASNVIPAPPPTQRVDAIDEAVRVVHGAHRPLLLLGGGARRATTQVRLLAERLGALVITTVNGKGVLPEHHPLSLGASIRLPSARLLLRSADVVIIVGSELGDSDLWGHPVTTDAAVVRIDIDRNQLNKNLKAAVQLHGDAEVMLQRLLDNLARLGPASTQPDWSVTAAALRATLADEADTDGHGYRAINSALSSALPAETTVAGDSAQVSYFGTVHFWPMDRPGQFLYPTGYATLGYGLPAAIGAKLANPEAPVIALVGDGGFLFTAQELLTAVERRLALPVIVVDNHGYREIREGMQERGIKPLGVDRPPVDFAALGAAFGGRGYAVRDVADLCDRVLESLSVAVPTVLSIDMAT